MIRLATLDLTRANFSCNEYTRNLKNSAWCRLNMSRFERDSTVFFAMSRPSRRFSKNAILSRFFNDNFKI
jgi:hypothetical protein